MINNNKILDTLVMMFMICPGTNMTTMRIHNLQGNSVVLYNSDDLEQNSSDLLKNI
jgi:hypothetical protein